MTFESIAAFYADDVARERSPEVDFGVMWADGERAWPRYRVSWVEATGEFYAVRLGSPGTVEVLGSVAPGDRAAAEEALDGWAYRDSMTLEWARGRLRMRDPGYVPSVDEALADPAGFVAGMEEVGDA